MVEDYETHKYKQFFFLENQQNNVV